MSLSGNLRTMPFPDVLQWVAQSRKTGALVVEGETTKKLYFRTGQIAAVSSEDPSEFLTYYLVGWGYVSEEELHHMLELQDRHGTLLGELLVILGRLDRDELQDVLRTQAREMVFDIFLWTEGDFRFLDEVMPGRKFQPLQIPLDGLLMEGVRRIDERRRHSSGLPAGREVPHVVKAVDAARFGADRASVLREIDGEQTVEQIAFACRMPLFDVAVVVAELIEGGAVRCDEAGELSGVVPGFGTTSWRYVVERAQKALAEQRLLDAHVRLTELRGGEQPGATAAADDLERQLLAEVERRGVRLEAVPESIVAPEDLQSVDCSPAEAFVLSRIDGRYTVADVLRQLPGAPLLNRLLISSLVGKRLVRVRPAPAAAEPREG